LSIDYGEQPPQLTRGSSVADDLRLPACARRDAAGGRSPVQLPHCGARWRWRWHRQEHHPPLVPQPDRYEPWIGGELQHAQQEAPRSR
jgi:hypothetical protein